MDKLSREERELADGRAFLKLSSDMPLSQIAELTFLTVGDVRRLMELAKEFED